MIPAAFDYVAPQSLEEALRCLAGETGNAVILAGGMSLIPALKLRLATPAVVVDIARLRELAGVARTADRIHIGALTTHEAVLAAPGLAEFPVFAETAGVIGDPQVRNRGTLGGSLAHAHPGADWPAVFLALRGEAALAGPNGRRVVQAEEFFTSVMSTAISAGEILTGISLPRPPARSGAAYSKMRQQASGLALVGVAAHVTLDRDGRIDAATVGVTGVNAVPFRARSLEARLQGTAPRPSELPALCADISEAVPMNDAHADAEYRHQLLRVHAGRALALALSRAHPAAPPRAARA